MPKTPSRLDQGKKRKTRKRAVLQFRIPEAEYRELAKTAAKSDLTISEVAARRLLAYPMMAKDLDESEGFLDQIARQENAQTELERRGHRKFVFWMGPSETGLTLLTASQLEVLLVKAATQGAELALRGLQK